MTREMQVCQALTDKARELIEYDDSLTVSIVVSGGDGHAVRVMEVAGRGRFPIDHVFAGINALAKHIQRMRY